MKTFFRFHFLIIIITLFFLNFLLLEAPENFESGTLVRIEEGATLNQISGVLQEKNVIKSRITFETLVILLGGEKSVKPGEYFFENTESVFTIAKRLSVGEKSLTPIKVTIPEGYNVEEMAETFSARLPNFNKKDFLDKAKGKEGYLFPDTYFFYNQENAEDVIKMLNDNFNKKIEPVLPLIASQGKEPEDILIMASIIEKEAKGDNDRALISGILWKRLSINMALQVDAWPETYKTTGLPEEPICNPGMEAIKAALSPEESAYLYYLHAKNGDIHFAKTFAEHRQNIEKYLK